MDAAVAISHDDESNNDKESCTIKYASRTTTNNQNNCTYFLFTSTKECVAGGPIKCVSLPRDDLCVYGHGPFLHRLMKTEETKFSNDRILVFDDSNIHGIRHCSNSNNIAAVFGGRYIAFVTNVLAQQHPIVKNKNDNSNNDNDNNDVNLMKVLSVKRKDIDEKGISNRLSLLDWIWDCKLIQIRKHQQTNNKENVFILLVGLAHNTVEVWNIHQQVDNHCVVMAQCNHQISGTTCSISYSMDIFASTEKIVNSTIFPSFQIAVGTVTNEILIWSSSAIEEYHTNSPDELNFARQNNRKVLFEHHLQGHKGVIHAVKFESNHGNKLLSTSDDRTVRLWSYQNNNESKLSWVLLWTGWGHTSRGWDVAFGPSGNLFLSTGEDRTLRIWDENGDCKSVLRGHACQCIWSVDVCKETAVTSGNNGTIAFYNLQHLYEGQVFSVPDDRHLLVDPIKRNKSNKGVISDTKKKKKKISKQQIIAGIKFVPKGNDFEGMVEGSSQKMIVATRAGSLMCLDTLGGFWTQMEPWSCSDPFVDSNHSSEQHEGCCMAIHPRQALAAVGTKTGDIVISCLQPLQRECSSQIYRKRVLRSTMVKSVQMIGWINDNILLSLHINLLCWWDFDVGGSFVHDKFSNDVDPKISPLVLRNRVSGMMICYAVHEATSRIVVGDTRGNICLFTISDHMSRDDPIDDIAHLRRVHSKEHVTAIVWKSNDRILSCGNDGLLVECAIHPESGDLIKIFFIPIAPFTALSHILNLTYRDAPSRIVVAGYYGNEFLVSDLYSGYEFIRLDTGGRQRSLEILADNNFDLTMRVAVCQMRLDGLVNIQIYCRGMNVSSRVCRTKKAIFSSNESVNSVALHGETIFDLCLFPITSHTDLIGLVTGSEDCSSKISLYQEKRLLCSTPLPPIESGTRAVCSCMLTDGRTLIVVGGKLKLQFFIAQVDSADGATHLNVNFLGFQTMNKESKIDQRINTVAAVSLCPDMDNVIVAAGDSNGCCHLFQAFLNCEDQNFEVMRFRYVDKRPIISMKIVQSDGRNILLAGNTAGELLVFFVTEQDENAQPLLRLKAHSMGTNAISAIPSKYAEHGGFNSCLDICSGGDDQSLFFASIIINSQISILRTLRKEIASVSALKGVEFVDNCHIVTTGYDQKLKIYRVSQEEIKMVEYSHVEVGDVNCLSCCKLSNKKIVCAVGGAGVELSSLEVQL